ncbi:hypothetical protein N9D29_08780 [Flavobacteriaceae bacterium]|nr:hypothetical protein [Flavobacteriaceae bacterium]
MKIGSYEIKNVEFSVLEEETASNLQRLDTPPVPLCLSDVANILLAN